MNCDWKICSNPATIKLRVWDYNDEWFYACGDCYSYIKSVPKLVDKIIKEEKIWGDE